MSSNHSSMSSINISEDRTNHAGEQTGKSDKHLKAIESIYDRLQDAMKDKLGNITDVIKESQSINQKEFQSLHDKIKGLENENSELKNKMQSAIKTQSMMNTDIKISRLEENADHFLSHSRTEDI